MRRHQIAGKSQESGQVLPPSWDVRGIADRLMIAACSRCL
jgi:hypothetical protein